MPISPVDLVVFDIGGVLAHFAGAAALQAMTGIADDDEVGRRWLSSPWVRRFESGRCSPEQFGAGMVTEWGLPMEPGDFVARFGHWLRSPLPGAEELVRATSVHVPVGCLSNTNALHWAGTISRWPLVALFRYRFLSFELGLLKPDRAIFDHVVETVGVDADRLLFLDDNPVNVDAAAAAGLVAHRVRGVDEARRALAAAGVLPPAG